MLSPRRGAAAALLLLAAVILLLLRLPPRAPPPAPPPRPQPVASQPAVTPCSSPSSASQPTSSQASATDTKTSEAKATQVSSTVDPASVAAHYVAGHSQAHASLCRRLGAGVKVLVLVTSAPAHAAARAAVRYTWGSFARRSDLALAFVLGLPPQKLTATIAEEDALYGDLIIGRFVDSYSNLTLKTLSMLEWTETYCPRAAFLLKTDDDMFINVPLLLKFAEARKNATKTIWGRVISKSLPNRGNKSKYFVPRTEYPGRVFPAFATGPAYLVSGDSVRLLKAAALKLRWLHLEDVLVTGLAAAAAGVRRTHAVEFHNRRAAAACAPRKHLALHMVRSHEQFDLWRRLMDPRTNCPQ